ncbi:MAG: hypothetical protein M3406_14710 [Chloroflexota bacterium]|nr:hypothetical protein [Chloroflexota bacterium]
MNGVVNWARLSFRFQRLEILLLGGAVLLASGLMLWWAFELSGVTAAYPDCNFFNDGSRGCATAEGRFFEIFGTAEIIIRNTWLAGFAVGIVLSVPLVAREVEHGTAQLAWTLGRSRVRWLIGRVAFAALVALVLTGLLAVTTEVLTTAMRPDITTSESFEHYCNRDPLIVGRAMLGLGAGVLVGALVGRQLPALLLGVLVVGSLYGASAFALPQWYHGEAEIRRNDEWLGSPLYIESGIELTSGERLPFAEVFEDNAELLDTYQTEDGTHYASDVDAAAGRKPLGRDYILIIPGERYNEIVARETVVFTGAGLILLGGSAAVTRRRRPT